MLSNPIEIMARAARSGPVGFRRNQPFASGRRIRAVWPPQKIARRQAQRTVIRTAPARAPEERWRNACPWVRSSKTTLPVAPVAPGARGQGGAAPRPASQAAKT